MKVAQLPFSVFTIKAGKENKSVSYTFTTKISSSNSTIVGPENCIVAIFLKAGGRAFQIG